ncbi:hypothetical protein AB0H83_24530 [Dactylosporangium sp. NPDC050688]|uniref:hypothetical protein n=1 Tax=Dactylosporangium sp. NPDC050688 TaxID=3157217 RepID=UPI0033FCF228
MSGSKAVREVGQLLHAETSAIIRHDPDSAAPTVHTADLAGLAITNQQARADLTAASARIVEAGDQTRRRLERDLHDGTQQPPGSWHDLDVQDSRRYRCRRRPIMRS